MKMDLRRTGMGCHRCRQAALVLGAMLLLSFAGCAAFFRGPCLPPEALPVAPFVDMHCHVAGLGAGGSGCFVSERLRRSWKVGFYFRSFGVSRRELEQQGDALCGDRLSAMLGQSRHVSRAVILALDGAVDDRGNLDAARTEFHVPNEFAAVLAARHTNLLFGASINPYRSDALARLDRAAADHAVLVKWLPSIQLIDPADERLAPFYRRMAELRLPLLVHTGAEHSFTWSKDEFADPARLRLPLSLGVTVIAAHAAWPGRHDGERDVDRLASLMKEYPNLYADISSLTQINQLGALREVLRRPEFRGRLVYGTDFPLINMPIVSPWFFPLDLSLRQRWQISRIKNPWDRDVALKQALGVPADVFTKAEKLLRL
jgi:predicted TIM-barrel fold metal-dependent hydrolase